MSFISYAQNFEDVMLWRALKHVERGFYIDIGAQDPVIDSVSLAFYEHGWRGVHVEPTTNYAEKIRCSRSNETVIQAALADKAGILKFFEIIDTGLSTGDPQIAEKYRASGFSVLERDVPCLTLANILDRYSDREIHWLKIDVEGMERQVLQGWPPSTVRPWVVVIEGTMPLTREETHDKWEPPLLELGYDFIYFDGLNRFYLSKAHLELKDAFRSGPNVFDGFALSGTASAPFCSQLIQKLNRTQEETQHLSHTLAERQQEMERLTKVVHEQNVWGQGALARIRTLDHERSTILRSWSWRITAPLRWVLTVVIRSVAPDQFLLGQVAHQANLAMRAITPRIHKQVSQINMLQRIYVRLITRAFNMLARKKTSDQSSSTHATATLVSAPQIEVHTQAALLRAMHAWQLGARVDN